MEEFEYDKNWESLAGSQPILGNYDDALKALARSARESSLRRFCPFTSMACLCLSESCWPWKLWQVQPGHIVFSSGGQFCVCTGSPYQKGSIVAWTRDPDEAVRELVGVLERYTAMKRLWRRVWAGRAAKRYSRAALRRYNR